MNPSPAPTDHGPNCDCGSDACLDARHDVQVIEATATQIADFLAARARTYPPFTEGRLAVQADADAVRRGAWRKR